jgi:curved DNA-binding protein
VLLDERLKTHILKEAMPGQRLVPKGKGGDVILEIYVRPLPTYGIDGSDLIADLPVTAREAALGASLDMPTLDRRVRLRVPAHARAGQKLSLKGRGHPVRRHVNLYAFLSIVNPSIKTKEGRALYEQMAREMPFDPLSEMKG